MLYMQIGQGAYTYRARDVGTGKNDLILMVVLKSWFFDRGQWCQMIIFVTIF